MQVHPSQIAPAQNFDIFYFFQDPNDTGTHYVRATIYDLFTGAVLATIPLTSASTKTRLFTVRTQAPADPVGTGRNIVAIATVFTDSAYTTPDLNYPEQEQYFLIKDLQATYGGGGGGDYRAIFDELEKMLDKKLKALPKPEKVNLSTLPFDALFGAMGALQREINRVPKQAPSHGRLHQHMETVRADVAAVKDAVAGLPAPEKVDLAPLASALQHIIAALTALDETTRNGAAAPAALVEQKLNEIAPALQQMVETHFKDYLGKQDIKVSFADLLKERAPEGKQDLSHLM